MVTESNTNLLSVLQSVVDAASMHQKLLSRNEGATRTTLINPILHVLGWDVSNPHLVTVEASAKRGGNTVFADYVLYDSQNIKAIVEAKPLGQNLQSHRSQVVDYAYAFKVKNIFLTNGLTWEHYNLTSFNPEAMTAAHVLNISDNTLGSTAACLYRELGSQMEFEFQDSKQLYQEINESLKQLEHLIDGVSGITKKLRGQPFAAVNQRLANLQGKMSSFVDTADEARSSAKRIENSLLAQSIIALVQENGAVEPTSSSEIYSTLQLYAAKSTLSEDISGVEDSAKLNMIEDAKKRVLSSKQFSSNATWLGRDLNRIKPALRVMGVEASYDRVPNGSFWSFMPVPTQDE